MANVNIMNQSTDKTILKVDSREPKRIFNLLTQAGIEYKKEFLKVGDFVFNDYCFERKEIGDFYGSIKGRLWEQVQNMQENYPNNFILVSGSLAKCKLTIPGFNKMVIHGATASLLTKQKINVLRVENDTELINLMMKICEKSTEPYTGFVKRLQMTDKDITANMISCIPTVGIKKAKLITEKYKTIKDVINANNKDLCKIKGIGNKIAIKIKELL